MYQKKQSIYQSQHAELYLEHLYIVEHYLTISIFVKSHGFTGYYNFCMQDEHVKDNISKLKDMDDFLQGSCKIIDADSDAFLCLEFEGRKFKVYGQLGGSYEDNYMKFSFLADQTVIKLLIDALSNSLKMHGESKRV